VIDKYQTGFFLITCDSPTDAISDCLNTDRVRRRLVVTSFFLVAAFAYSCFFFGVSTVNIFFVSKLHFDNINGQKFFSNCFEWLSFAWHGSSLHSAMEHGDF